MGVVIYGAANSTCTQRVLATLFEKGVTDYKLQSIKLLEGEQKGPEHRKRQPFGLIPALEDGDFKLFESRAICYYIAQKYADQGVKLLPDPTDLKGIATFEQWHSVERDSFDVYAFQVLLQKLFNKWRGLEPDIKFLEHFESGFLPKLDVYDEILSKQAYMGGNEFSLVDIHYLSLTQKLFQADAGYLINDRPHLKAWWERVSGRDSWKKVVEMSEKAQADFLAAAQKKFQNSAAA